MIEKNRVTHSFSYSALLLVASVVLLILSACGGEKKLDLSDDEVSTSDDRTQAQASEGEVTTAMVGGVEMSSQTNILENLKSSPEYTKFIMATEAAGFSKILSEPGPVTVFAPTNAAFDKLAEGTLENLLLPEKKSDLVTTMANHLLAGENASTGLLEQIDAGEGTYQVNAVSGGALTFKKNEDTITVEVGGESIATIGNADVLQSNGVVHVIDTVLLP